MQVALCKLMNPFMNVAVATHQCIGSIDGRRETNASNGMECDALFDIGQAKVHTCVRSATTL